MVDFKDVIDTLESVPEEYRVAYAPEGEKFKLRDEFKPFANAIVGLNTTLGRKEGDLKKSNKEAADRRGVIAAFEEMCAANGVTIEEGKPLTEALKAHLDTLTAQAKNGGELKVSMDNIRREFEKKTRQIEEASEEKTGKMSRTLEKYLVGQQVTASLAKHKGSVDLLLPTIRGFVKVVQEGDDYVVRVVDGEGNVRTDGKGGFLDIDGYVSELKTQPAYARAFESDATGGSGTRQSTKQTPMRTGVDRSKMTSVDKIKAGLQKTGK